MSLEQFCRSRLVVLNETATAYEAARAMEENHIGLIIVGGTDSGVAGVLTDRDLALRVIGGDFLPHVTPLRDVMTANVHTVPSTAAVGDVIEQMREHCVRRIPIVEDGKVAGVVTLDDLLAANAIDVEDAGEISRAQLSQSAPLKPAGATHPMPAQSVDPAARVERRVQHAEQTSSSAAELVSAATGIVNRDRAMTALEVLAGWLARRLTPGEAKDMLSQLPSELRDRLRDRRVGPDKHVTRATIEGELERRVGLSPAEASALVPKLGKALGLLLSPGELAQVRGQLPEELREVLPDPSLAHAGGELRT